MNFVKTYLAPELNASTCASRTSMKSRDRKLKDSDWVLIAETKNAVMITAKM
jgi:hypothetical protein